MKPCFAKSVEALDIISCVLKDTVIFLNSTIVSSFLTSSFSFSALSLISLCAIPTVKGTSPVSLLGSGLTALFFSFSNFEG